MTITAETKILLLEDDYNLGLIIEEHLKLHGFDVVLCKDGVEGLEKFNKQRFDLCLVDIMMPKMDGFTFATRVREKNDTIPLIFLTAKSLQEDKIKGFKIGCDDYITKPFSIEELMLRINAVLKRVKGDIGSPKQSIFEIGEYSFDSNNQTLNIKSSSHNLTSRESELLRLLCVNMDRTLDRSYALKEIWGEENYFNSRSMDVFISKLRKYLKDDTRVQIINVHGKGFKLLVNK